MKRLQISLPPWQAEYLAERAEREGISMAEVVRRLLRREARAGSAPHDPAGMWAVAGLVQEEGPLIDGVPVSENPDLYLYGQPPTEEPEHE